MTAYVKRYVATAIRSRGMRELIDPAQGRFTFASREDAQARIDAILSANPPDRVAQLIGTALEVRECECYPVHFDPVGRYFAD